MFKQQKRKTKKYLNITELLFTKEMDKTNATSSTVTIRHFICRDRFEYSVYKFIKPYDGRRETKKYFKMSTSV